jgi:transcriptional regulator with XRE-family HTH domain
MTRLREIREDAGYSLRELAKEIGSSHVAIYRWEMSRCVPQKRFAVRLVQVLGQPLDVLLEEKKSDGPKKSRRQSPIETERRNRCLGQV